MTPSPPPFAQYIVITAKTMSGADVTLLRGFKEIPSHADALEIAAPPLALAGYTEVTCIGGGVARHLEGEHKVVLGGESEGFGKADHTAAKAICENYFGDGYSVTIDENLASSLNA